MIPVLAEIQNPARIEQLLPLFLQAGQDNVQKGRNITPSPRAAVPPTHFLSENAKKQTAAARRAQKTPKNRMPYTRIKTPAIASMPENR